MTSKKILITGGAGFIGSALGKALIDGYGADVVAVDNLLEQVHPSGELPASFDPRIRFVKGDVRDADVWNELFATFKPDMVAHLAAETGTAIVNRRNVQESLSEKPILPVFAPQLRE